MKSWTSTIAKLFICLAIAAGCIQAKATPTLPPAEPPGAAATPARPVSAPATQAVMAAPATALPPAVSVAPATSTAAPAATQAPTATATPPAPDGQRARQHLEVLAGEIGARAAGSAQEAKAGEYIQAVLKASGYEIQLQPFSFNGNHGSRRSQNIIAVKPGRSARELIVGAHYDSVTAGRGADDNASGVAVLLEVAEKISQVETPFTVRFIAFGSEEVDLDGSRYYARKMSQAEIANTRGMINMDSLAAGDITYMYGQSGTAKSLIDPMLQIAQRAGYSLETRTAEDLDNADGTPCDCSDYSPFEKLGLTFAYFEATNWNLGDFDGYTQVDASLGENGRIWHTRYDTIQAIDQMFPGRIDQHLALYVTVLYDTLIELDQ